MELIRLAVGAKIFAVNRSYPGRVRGIGACITPGFRSLGCTDDQERRNFSKIRFYGEIFLLAPARSAAGSAASVLFLLRNFF